MTARGRALAPHAGGCRWGGRSSSPSSPAVRGGRRGGSGWMRRTGRSSATADDGARRRLARGAGAAIGRELSDAAWHGASGMAAVVAARARLMRAGDCDAGRALPARRASRSRLARSRSSAERCVAPVVVSALPAHVAVGFAMNAIRPPGWHASPAIPRAGARPHASPSDARGSAGSAAGHEGREALVVELHRHRQPLGEPARRTHPASPRSAPSRRPASRQRQPDDDALGAAVAHEPRRRAPGPCAYPVRRTGSIGVAAVPSVAHRATRSGRCRSRARSTRIAERAIPRARTRIAARAAAIASGSFSGSRPPACAIVSRPPPPPPATSAAALTTAPALTPRATSAGVTAATRCTRAVDHPSRARRRLRTEAPP